MNNLAKLEKEVMSLAPEERALLVDSLLRSINPPESDTDKKWVVVAQNRLGEMRSGKVKPVPGEDVFERVRNRFDK